MVETHTYCVHNGAVLTGVSMHDYAALEAEMKDVRGALARLKMGFDHVEAERDELKRRVELYEARERADIETLHEFADAIAEGRNNG